MATKAAPLSERDVQREIVGSLRRLGLRCVHVPNGAYLSGDGPARARQWGAMLGDGAVAGFPDLLIMTGDGRTGFLEVKRPGKIPATDHTRRQDSCRDALARDGFPVALVQSLDEALAAVTAWGFLTGRVHGAISIGDAAARVLAGLKIGDAA